MKRTNRARLISQYTEAGLAVFSCGRGPDGKAPNRKGWPQTKLNPHLDPDSLAPMYGVVLGKEHLVLDVDPRRYKDGVDQQVELWEQLGLSKPDTFVVRTGSGGCHIYFKKPRNIRVRSRVPGYPAIDIKTAGGYVIGAASAHDETGKSYRVEAGSPKKIAECPPALLELVSASNSIAPSREPAQGLICDDVYTRRQFETYLLNAEPAVQGDGGENRTFVTACEGRDLGLPEKTVFELMSLHYNPRCEPPWEEEDLERKVANAFRYAQNVPGNRHPDIAFAGIGTEPKTSLSQISTISATELFNKHLPEPRWAIDSILPEGLTIIAGAPKVGKSWMAFSLCIAVATGTKALGNFPARKGLVLYLALEDNQRRLRDRLHKLSNGDDQLISTQLLLSSDILRFDKGGLKALDDWLLSHPECRLVIIDTLGRFSPSPDKKMNAYDNDYRVLAAMQKLAHSRGIALVFITHLRKQHSNDPYEQVTGSTGITGAADAIWLLTRGRGDSTGILRITGRDVEEKELAVHFDKATCQWSALGDAERIQLGRERQEIIECLEQSDEPMGPKEVAQAIGRKEGNIKNLMRKMYQGRQIGKTNRGKYCAARDIDYFGDFEPETHASTALDKGLHADDL
jgi:hypothetical protein